MALLELLLQKDNRAYISFYNALVKEAYDDLASLLYGDLPHSSFDKSSSDSSASYGEWWGAVGEVSGGLEHCVRCVGVPECWRRTTCRGCLLCGHSFIY